MYPRLDSLGHYRVMAGPQIHLTAAAGRSCHYHDVVDYIGKDVVEEEVVAGTDEGNHIVVSRA